jgi:glutaredoxin
MRSAELVKTAALLLTLLCAGLAHAQGVYKWVDKDGKVYYGDRPPAGPGFKVQERQMAAPAAEKQVSFVLRQAISNYPVTLYVSDNCETSCKDGRDFLNQRGIPFTEKLVATQEDVDALKQVSGGATEVPFLQVGSRTYKGWLMTGWQRLLDAAGYPKEGAH